MAQQTVLNSVPDSREVGTSRSHWHRESYVRHRDYSPTLGRFIERDPVGFEAGDGNWYRFVGNGPTGKTDPSGLYVDLAIEVISIGTGAWSFCTNVWAGHLGAAAVDAGGIVLDVGFALVPGAPGGTGLVVKAGREAAERAAKEAAERAAREAAEHAARAAREAAEKAAKGGGRCAAQRGPQFPGVDATKAPEGFVWKGKPGSTPGSKQGSFYNPKTGESLRPDRNHGDPIGGHWDYRDANGNWYRIFPDGRMEPK